MGPTLAQTPPTWDLFFLHSVFFSLIWERIPDVRDFSKSWIYAKWRVKLLSTRPTYYHPIDAICNKWVLSEKNSNFRFFFVDENIHHLKQKTFVWTMWTLLERKMSRKVFSWWTQKANQSAVLDKYISDNEDGLILMDEREDCDGISWWGYDTEYPGYVWVV